MVRCMLNGKVYETCFEGEEEEETEAAAAAEEEETEAAAAAEEEETEAAAAAEEEEDSEDVGGVLKCMMNGVIYYPGMDNAVEAEALRELRAALRASKIIESHHDDLGRPRLKIVYVDVADIFSDTNLPSKAEEHIGTIIQHEKEKEIREGNPRPRLIFVTQDRDFWPGSEKDPDAMARRALKEMKAHPYKADYMEITVPLLPEEEKIKLEFPYDSRAREAYDLKAKRLCFMRYFDPSAPGTKFIIDNSPAERESVLRKYMEDPVLWKQWMSATGAHAAAEYIRCITL